MKLTQVSVFLENKKGRLFEVCRVLGENGVNIRALNVADSKDFGIVHMVVSDTDKALKAFKSAGLTARQTEVVGVEVDDRPGGLAKVLKTIDDADINIEYMYGFVEKASDKALMVFRFDNIDKAIDVLKKHGIGILKKEQIASL